MSPINFIYGLSISLLFSLMGTSCTYSQGPYEQLYIEHCASCHGKKMEGNAHTSALIGKALKHGEEIEDLYRGIETGYLESGMPAFGSMLSEGEIKGISIYLSEARKNFSMGDFSIQKQMRIPSETITSEKMNFRLETVIEDLDPWPFSIAPLPDGSFLLSEKMRGLSIISPEGKQSELIHGLPDISSAKEAGKEATGLIHGLGWMLDVALHPNYEENGWVYISYGDRCKKCNTWSKANYAGYISLLKVIRGRIKDNMWVDQEVIWKADKEYYTPTPETTTGGRLAFDDKGHVYFSLGAKLYLPHEPFTVESFHGIQDLSMPYGKIHRVKDDGRIPEDNPYLNTDKAMKSIWTLGHRSPQGLEFDNMTQSLWGTEMGPRGGDEVNYLKKGHNYGWPLVSRGVNYTGTNVEFGTNLNLNPDSMELEDPVLDLTPSPAISSFAICHSPRYPKWEGNLIVGTLKATQLYRMEVKEGKVLHRETLLDNLARIRDVELGFDGYLYLLLEHVDGGAIVRLVPVP